MKKEKERRRKKYQGFLARALGFFFFKGNLQTITKIYQLLITLNVEYNAPKVRYKPKKIIFCVAKFDVFLSL